MCYRKSHRLLLGRAYWQETDDNDGSCNNDYRYCDPHQLDNQGSTIRRSCHYWDSECPGFQTILDFANLSLQGNGFNSSSIPVYQSETCGGAIRGALVCLNSTITIVGLVIVNRISSSENILTLTLDTGVLVGLWLELCRW